MTFPVALLFSISLTATAAFARDAGKVITVVGKVSYRTSDTAKAEPLTPGKVLQEGWSIKTEADGKAKLLLTDKTVIDLNPATEFKVDQFKQNGNDTANREVSLAVKFGKIRSSVNSPVSDKGKFLIKTKSTTMGVRGTEFVVNSTFSASGDKGVQNVNTQITVIHGKVAVNDLSSPNAKPIELTTGKQLVSEVRVNIATGGFVPPSGNSPASSGPKVVDVPKQELDQMKNETTVQDTTFKDSTNVEEKSKSEREAKKEEAEKKEAETKEAKKDGESGESKDTKEAKNDAEGNNGNKEAKSDGEGSDSKEAKKDGEGSESKEAKSDGDSKGESKEAKKDGDAPKEGKESKGGDKEVAKSDAKKDGDGGGRAPASENSNNSNGSGDGGSKKDSGKSGSGGMNASGPKGPDSTGPMPGGGGDAIGGVLNLALGGGGNKGPNNAPPPIAIQGVSAADMRPTTAGTGPINAGTIFTTDAVPKPPINSGSVKVTVKFTP